MGLSTLRGPNSITGKSSRNLAGKRTSHMKFCHKEIPLHLRASRINRTEIIKATTELPPEKRGWTCAFCDAGPVIHSYHQKQINIRHHYNSKRKGRDTSVAAIQRARLQQYRRNKSKQPCIWKGKEQMIAKRIAQNQRNMSIGGHNLAIIRPDWATRPCRSEKNPSARKGFFFTCVDCHRTAHYRQSQWNIQCKGTPSSFQVEAVPIFPRKSKGPPPSLENHKKPGGSKVSPVGPN